ncbi:hypothetical protein Dcar01_03517 [Deinococcus carri]|uniref:Lipoprotein n=1 Tax=Deinococcus carri TaxID=1211323 RepID=A0ABP9WBP9_9DEIO
MKKMLLFLVAGLGLASCAPVAQLAQPNEHATLTRENGSLVLANPGPDALTGDPSRAGDGPALTALGTGLTPDAAAATWCRTNAARTQFTCNLPNVPAGQQVRVTLAGTVLDAGVLAYRESVGARPVLVWLK